MSDINTVLDALKGIQEKQTQLETRLDDVAKSSEEARKSPWGVPSIRTGEDPYTSRGYSFLKAFGVLSGFVGVDDAKVEAEVSGRLKKYYDGWGYKKTYANSVMLPFAGDLICQDDKLANEIKCLVKMGVDRLDPNDYQRTVLSHPWMRQRALSWIDNPTGGTLVAPPMQGELIELFRNNEVFMQAGARQIAMPPNGRIVFPRQTSSSTAYWVGESTSITDSTPGTGDVVLSAKKLGVLTKIPNELFRFASVSIEQFIREDMARVMALKMDKSLLEAVGSTIEPKGVISYANINSHTASTTGANGDTFEADDVNLMISKVEAKNATFGAWIMHPVMWATIANRRAHVYTGSGTTELGPYLFNVNREFGDDLDLARLKVGRLAGYPVYKSTQVSRTRVKSSGTDLTYILGGDFTDFLVAVGGALEFQISTQGDTPFATDQTWFRGILYCDGAPRHEASYVLCDQIDNDL